MNAPFYVDIRPNHSGVTGSCFHVKAVFPDRKTYSCLIDCGLFQGKDEATFNEEALLPSMKNADSLIITHNHVDHIGRVPELVRNGFRGKIITSKETSGVVDKAWRDCEKIEKLNASKANRLPRFKPTHVTEATRRIEPLPFLQRHQIHPNIWVTLFKNGHVFGSAMVLLEIESGLKQEWYKPINFLFTGDYNDQNFFFTVPELPAELRKMPLHIISEATYGESSRQVNRGKLFEDNIIKHSEKGREIFIPTFAFERGQVILAILRKMQKSGRLSSSIPIYLEGKLLKDYTTHYVKMADKYFDKVDIQELLPEYYQWIAKPLQREEILTNGQPKIIIASGGMLSFGPSQAYINNVISNPNAVIHFTGYQCEGTIGHSLKMANETGEPLELMGKLVSVECQVLSTEEFSSHALIETLIDLITKFPNMKSISLNHGTSEAKQNFAKILVKRKLAKEVGILSKGNLYRFTPYKLEKVFQVSE